MTATPPSLPNCVLDVWQYCSNSHSTTWVYPDGCCDLIWHEAPGKAPVWFVTELADATYAVECQAQHAMAGFRLRAGVRVDEQAVLSAIAGKDARDEAQILSVLCELAHVDCRVEETLACLAQSPTVRGAQQSLGVSERSLERLVRASTGRSPIYWRQLARVRQAASQVLAGMSLGDIAADLGYTDQAHMGREFQRWFGTSPGTIRRGGAQYQALSASGYG